MNELKQINYKLLLYLPILTQRLSKPNKITQLGRREAEHKISGTRQGWMNHKSWMLQKTAGGRTKTNGKRAHSLEFYNFRLSPNVLPSLFKQETVKPPACLTWLEIGFILNELKVNQFAADSYGKVQLVFYWRSHVQIQVASGIILSKLHDNNNVCAKAIFFINKIKFFHSTISLPLCFTLSQIST